MVWWPALEKAGHRRTSQLDRWRAVMGGPGELGGIECELTPEPTLKILLDVAGNPVELTDAWLQLKPKTTAVVASAGNVTNVPQALAQLLGVDLD